MSRSPRTARIPALAGAVALLAAAHPALGASVALTGASPAAGAVLPTQTPPYSVVFEWTSDLTGCGVASSSAQLVVLAPDGSQLAASPVTGAPPNGRFTLTATPQAPSTYRWYVSLACPSAPGGEVHSEERTVTLTGPDPAPRLAGPYRVLVAGSVQTWRFAPRCAAGACATLATRPGGGRVLLRYDVARRVYRGTFASASPASERICVVTRRLNGVVVSRRTHRDVYAARSGTVRLSVRDTALDPTGVQTLATGLVGTQRARYVPTARGRRLGCPGGGFAVAPLTAQRR